MRRELAIHMSSLCLAAATILVCAIAMALEPAELVESLRQYYARDAFVSHVVPSVVAPGGLLTIRGDGFGAASGSVLVGGEACTVEEWSDGFVRARAPSDGAAGLVTVQTGERTLESPFEVIVATPSGASFPAITSVTPANGDLQVDFGEVLTVQGHGFGSVQGRAFIAEALRHRWGDDDPATVTAPEATVLSWTDTQVSVSVPDTCWRHGRLTLVFGQYAIRSQEDIECP